MRRSFMTWVSIVVVLMVVATGCATVPRQSSLPAFPGAEGFGANTPGGRGGKVLFVTNLSDYDPKTEEIIPGSLRAVVNVKGPRIIIFRISGTITLKTGLTITEPYLTLAGQTAPGDGICMRGHGTAIRTHDVIVRYMRFRVGDEWGVKNKKNFAPDSLAIAGGQTVNGKPTTREDILDPSTKITFGARDIIIDHCSVSWGVDECLAITHADNITVQWCLVAEGLAYTTHDKTMNHSMGLMVGYVVPHITLHHNLIVHCNDRNPSCPTDYAIPYTMDVVNNVVYDWGFWAGIGYGKENHNGTINWIGNYYVRGPRSRITEGLHIGVKARVYARGNIGPMRVNLQQDEYDAVYWAGVAKGVPGLKADTPFVAPPVTTHSYLDAYDLVLGQAGATLPRRDAVDVRLVREVKTRKGKHINHPEEVGGWPLLKSEPAPKDSDNDGMPDDWETKHGLGPAVANSNGDADGDGYTDIEEWLNNTDPNAAGRPAGTESDPSVTKPSRGHRRCIRGFMLTANRTDTDWLYDLKPNWNHTARPDEITRTEGTADTKEMLGTLAPGQEVFWYPWQQDTPQDAILIELREHCKKLKLHARGFPPESP